MRILSPCREDLECADTRTVIETGIEDSRWTHDSRRVRRSLDSLRSICSGLAPSADHDSDPKSPYMLHHTPSSGYCSRIWRSQ
jgi:hypothetical protein